ncbi:chaperone protein DnaJ-like [Lolium rigidum]|uniref:chaperone protein DnaJ-like n=1 Tax=Lolium rigidum TaxID=89674 RepID=UPI001F5CA991|nr:chaperone protein DnaJ-like [Lolium rigidum]
MTTAGSSGIGKEDASGADLYAVLGLKKDCSDADLRLAYRRLAMIWHPDRCSASGGSTRVEEAKERFQEIQGAYSVLSDSGKRLLYDVGVYDSDYDDEEQDVSGMGGFLGEMAEMMNQVTPASFEELQQLFVDMFQADLVGGFGFGGEAPTDHRAQAGIPPCDSRSTFAQAPPASCIGGGVNKRCSSAMDSGMPSSARDGTGIGGRKKQQTVSTSHGVS